MGLLDKLMGNASEVDAKAIQEEFAQIMAPGETVEKAYQLVRDSFIFTNKRLILIDKQGMTGAKVEYHSYPYSKINHFSIETAGHFDRDAELKIWISGSDTPVSKEFNRKLSVYEVQATLAHFVLG